MITKIKVLDGGKGKAVNPFNVPNRTDEDDEKYIAFDPDDRENILYTIRPVLMTQDEFDNLPEYQF